MADSFFEDCRKRMMALPTEACPSCSKEYAGLEQIQIVFGGEARTIHLCGRCAYSTDGLQYLANEFPIPGAKLWPLRHGGMKIEIGGRYFIVDNVPVLSLRVTDSYSPEKPIPCGRTSGAWSWISRRLFELTEAPAATATPDDKKSRDRLLKRVMDGKAAAGGPDELHLA